MSFSEDPFKHIAVTHSLERGISWECNSCGYEAQYPSRSDKPAKIYPADTPVIAIISDFWNHVMESHHYTREDTKDWS